MTTMISDKMTGLERLELARFPTPLEPAPRLADALRLDSLWIKREDQSGYALGGNKLRQLDFILAEAIQKQADVVIATAGSQSNFCRSLAAAAAKLELGCHLHLRAKTGTELAGNLLLNHIFGATVTFTEHTDPWDPSIAAELDAIAAKYHAAGRAPQVVQLTGVSANVGIAAWATGAGELLDDFMSLPGMPDHVVVTCGSGLTLAGLALGFKRLNVLTRLVGISAQQPENRLKAWIIKAAGEAADWLGWPERILPDDFDIIDDAVFPGYGQSSQTSVSAVELAGKTEGLVLDPVYSGKGLAGMRIALRDGRLSAGGSAVFLHSGGTPGLFTHAAAFASDGKVVK